jgi:hypothetical protein
VIAPALTGVLRVVLHDEAEVEVEVDAEGEVDAEVAGCGLESGGGEVGGENITRLPVLVCVLPWSFHRARYISSIKESSRARSLRSR